MTLVYYLERKLKEKLPGKEAQSKLSPIHRTPSLYNPLETAKQSAVLILLYPFEGTYKTILIIRTDIGGIHSGQIALPGGKVELEDKSVIDTALREANEEIGIDIASVKVLGKLTPLYIPVSNYMVHPVVAHTPSIPNLTPSDTEVADIIEISLKDLYNNKATVKITTYSNNIIKTPAYILYNELKLWGATAMILSEFEALYNDFLEETNQ